MMFLWLIIIGVVIYLLVRGNKGGSQLKSGDDPVELLKKRFINGEITEEEYKKMRKVVND